MNERYEKRKASGKCVICGGVRENKNRLFCNKCTVRQKQRKIDRATQEKINLLNKIREMVGYEV